MIDVIDGTLAVANIDKGTQHIDDVLVGQYAFTGDTFTTQPTVELHAADGRKVITLVREEQVVEQVFCGFFGWRLARTHHPVNLDQSL